METTGIEGRRRAAIKEGKAGYTRRRQEIIETSAQVFRELGYEAATLNDVATRLNTDRASLYYYVGSKEELLHEIVRIVLNENVATAERVKAQAGTAIEKIESLVEEMISSYERNYPHAFVYVDDMGRISREDSDWAREVVRSSKTFETILESILEQGKADGELRPDLNTHLCALALFGMVNWTHRWYRPDSRFSASEITATFSTLFLDGYSTRRNLRRGSKRKVNSPE